MAHGKRQIALFERGSMKAVTAAAEGYPEAVRICLGDRGLYITYRCCPHDGIRRARITEPARRPDAYRLVNEAGFNGSAAGACSSWVTVRKTFCMIGGAGSCSR